MTLAVHALLARIEQREFAGARKPLAQRRCRNRPRHGRPERASRMSECGGKTLQRCAFAS